MNCIDFVKLSAGGNDFILIDNRADKLSRRLPKDVSDFSQGSLWSDLVREVCERKRSIGADGVLILERSEAYDVKMRVFNPDGTEVGMCGNGARCVALYLSRQSSALSRQSSALSHQPKSETGLVIETGAGALKAEVMDEDRVRLKMSDPKDYRADLKLDIEGKIHDVFYINTGVPHVVSFVDDLDGVDVKRIGRVIRYHSEFQPEGTNADFVKVVDSNVIKIRTYERGVEAETLSCGTGAVASCIVSAKAGRSRPPVWVQTKGGDRLRVYFDIEGDLIRSVCLEGEAKFIYEGKFWGKIPRVPGDSPDVPGDSPHVPGGSPHRCF